MTNEEAIRILEGYMDYNYPGDIEAFEMVIKSFKNERPQGKWLDIYTTHIAYECSNCHRKTPITDYFNFCPNCGADMREGDNE